MGEGGDDVCGVGLRRPPVQFDPVSSSQASPPRTRVVFVDFATPSYGARVSSKCRNRVMHKNRSSAPSSPILTPSDNKADSSNGSRSGTLASTRRVGSSPSDSYQVSNPNLGLSHGSPLHPTSKKGVRAYVGVWPRASILGSSPTYVFGCTLRSVVLVPA
ncbi:hypothetical protein D5086_027048 [Populus alba]|uniref:Uncharacterized protein n=1 Tax=Populus alba TaxID=43335 RepID=A0ACC4B538_POPAL